MPGTPSSIDIRQTETRTLQDQLNASAVEGMDFTLASINNELTAPGRLIAQTTPSLVVNVGAGKVVNPNTGKNRILPPLSSSVLNFLGGTITFPSTSGTITNSNGSNASITIGASQFVAVLVEANSSNNIVLTVGSAAGSLGSVVVPPTNSSNIQLGYIVAESDSGSIIQNITNAMLYQFVSGGGGGGGTVTSVALAVPAFLSVSGSPITTSGTITVGFSGSALPVPNGGTGDISFSAFALIAGGTTSTGPLQQVSGTGTTGQVLTSNGSSALPTWQSPSGGFPNLQTFTSSGTFTAPYTGTIMIMGVAGGGGGGAGGTGGTINNGGGGGSGGNWSWEGVSVVSGNIYTVTIGAGGIGGNSPGGNGSNGGVTQFLLSGAIIIGWNGGNLGTNGNDSGPFGGAGGASMGNGGAGGNSGPNGVSGSSGLLGALFSAGTPGSGGGANLYGPGGGGGASYGSGASGGNGAGATNGASAAANTGGGGGGAGGTNGGIGFGGNGGSGFLVIAY